MHLEGNRLVLTCMAEGSWPLEFKWLHNNRELTKFSLEYRQAAPPPHPPPGHQGHCHARKGCRGGGGGGCSVWQLEGWDSRSSAAGRLGWQKTALPHKCEDLALLSSAEHGWEVGLGAAQTGWPMRQWTGWRW